MNGPTGQYSPYCYFSLRAEAGKQPVPGECGRKGYLVKMSWFWSYFFSVLEAFSAACSAMRSILLSRPVAVWNSSSVIGVSVLDSSAIVVLPCWGCDAPGEQSVS